MLSTLSRRLSVHVTAENIAEAGLKAHCTLPALPAAARAGRRRHRSSTRVYYRTDRSPSTSAFPKLVWPVSCSVASSFCVHCVEETRQRRQPSASWIYACLRTDGAPSSTASPEPSVDENAAADEVAEDPSVDEDAAARQQHANSCQSPAHMLVDTTLVCHIGVCTHRVRTLLVTIRQRRH